MERSNNHDRRSAHSESSLAHKPSHSTLSAANFQASCFIALLPNLYTDMISMPYASPSTRETIGTLRTYNQIRRNVDGTLTSREHCHIKSSQADGLQYRGIPFPVNVSNSWSWKMNNGELACTLMISPFPRRVGSEVNFSWQSVWNTAFHTWILSTISASTSADCVTSFSTTRIQCMSPMIE